MATGIDFNASLSNGLVSGNNTDEINAMFGAQAAPTIAGYQSQAATALQQAALVGPNEQLQAGNLQSQAGYSMADSLLNEQGLALQGQGISSQAGTLAQQQAIVQQENPLNQQLLANTTAGAASAGKYITQEEQLAAQQYGVTQQGLGLQQKNLNYQLPLAEQAAAGQAAAQGATNTVGARQAQGTLKEQYGYQTGMLTNQGKQAALSEQGTQQGLQQQGAQNALTQQSDFIQQQLGQLGQQSQAIGYGGQQAQYANQLAQLGVQSQQQGLSAQQAQSQLGFGLGQLGIQSASDLAGFYGQAEQADAGAAAAQTAAIGQAGAATGFGAQAAISSFNPNAINGPK